MPETFNLPGGATLKWFGPEITEGVRAEAAKRLRTGLEYVKAQVQRNIRTPARVSGGSKEGDYPHANTGALLKSIFVEVDEANMEGLVGTTLMYGLWLEFGVAGGKVITAAPGKTLSWVDAKTGARVFAKRVVQGAIKGRGYLRRTAAECEIGLRRIWNAPWPLAS